MMRFARQWVSMSALLLATGCAHAPVSHATLPWNSARQLVLVTTTDWNVDHGLLRRYVRSVSGWRLVGPPQPVMVGRTGIAWGIGLHPAQADGPQKREGDGRSPAGVFAIGEAFGYGPAAVTALPYEPMQATDYCVDVSGSPLYNRIVDARSVGEQAVAGATEPMRRDLHADGDQRYRLGFVIRHNDAGVAMGGSCIFAHIWKSPQDATSGCTAMAPTSMGPLLSWLRPDAEPIFVLLPLPELRRFRAAWALPNVPDTADVSQTGD
jgi:L,D-peptidoglycan transpeptidase YkuD (ErfK/YbiS/YcfS/YnhG family)